MSASKLRQSHHAILAPNEVVYGSGALQSLGRALLSRLVLFMKAVGSTWPYTVFSESGCKVSLLVGGHGGPVDQSGN